MYTYIKQDYNIPAIHKAYIYTRIKGDYNIPAVINSNWAQQVRNSLAKCAIISVSLGLFSTLLSRAPFLCT